MSQDRTLTKQEKHESSKRAKELGVCRWCGLDVKRLSSKRRSFCSDECVHEFMLRSDPGYVRTQVYKRDHGICQKCGLNCSSWFAAFKRWMMGQRFPSILAREDAAKDYFRTNGGVPYVPDWTHRSTFWDVDHRIEVCNGGGQCGLDNLEILCIPCHRAKTIELNKNRKNKKVVNEESPSIIIMEITDECP